MCIYACISIQSRGGLVSLAPLENFEKKNCLLRLLLLPFWNRSRAVVAMWSAEYCTQFLPVSYPYLDVTNPADIKFLQGSVVRRTAGGVTNGLGCSVSASFLAETHKLSST